MSSSALAITIDSEPLVLFAPDQAPDAEQEVVLDDDQVSVMDSSTNFSVSEVVRLRDGTPATGGFGALPPPPQDPKAVANSKTVKLRFRIQFIVGAPNFYSQDQSLHLECYLIHNRLSIIIERADIHWWDGRMSGWVGGLDMQI
jgi:hypothetical protein